jgi:hypothetical protein
VHEIRGNFSFELVASEVFLRKGCEASSLICEGVEEDKVSTKTNG